jgi:hypothetical protein
LTGSLYKDFKSFSLKILLFYSTTNLSTSPTPDQVAPEVIGGASATAATAGTAVVTAAASSSTSLASEPPPLLLEAEEALGEFFSESESISDSFEDIDASAASEGALSAAAACMPPASPPPSESFRRRSDFASNDEYACYIRDHIQTGTKKMYQHSNPKIWAFKHLSDMQIDAVAVYDRVATKSCLHLRYMFTYKYRT